MLAPPTAHARTAQPPNGGRDLAGHRSQKLITVKAICRLNNTHANSRPRPVMLLECISESQMQHKLMVSVLFFSFFSPQVLLLSTSFLTT